MNLYPMWRSFPCAKWLTILVCSWVCSQHAASGATIKVTTAGDDDSLKGTTLRQAITAANKDKSHDVIVFEIPAGQDRIIDLESQLPDLTSNISIINTGDAVTIRRGISIGKTQPPEFCIFTVQAGNTVILDGLIITNLHGAVLNRGDLTMRRCTIRPPGSGEDSTVTAIRNAGAGARLLLQDCMLSDNRFVSEVNTAFPYAGGGGALLNYASAGTATAILENCVFLRNSTQAGQILGPPGGAIANVAFQTGTASLSLTGCTLEQNSSAAGSGGGGGIYNFTESPTATAAVVIVETTFRNNQAGGGISNRPNVPEKGTVQIARSTFAANSSAIINRGTLSLTNCTLSQNVQGAIHNSAGSAEVTNCTFADNPGNAEGRGQSVTNHSGATFTTGNSLFSATSPGVNFSNAGTFTSRGHNLCNDTAGGPLSTGPGGLLNATGDQRVTHPKIRSLANNFGPTQTCALESDSPAINAGDDSMAPPTDQRGRSREGRSDIGAFEFVTATPVSAKPGRLGNISTRLGVETGDNVLIGGFIVTGTEPKRVMLRAIGSSLPFENRLANPVLELFDSAGALIESNDNWVDSINKQAIIDTTIPPSSDLESAIVISLPANSSAYTAVVRGVDDGTGIGLVEVYDLDSAVDSKLANISTRGLVKTGDNVLIAGTIITGQSSQKVIIRAIGPSLPVAGKLEDPMLELFDANGALLAANDNWRTGGQESEINATGVPPSSDLESAIVYQLPSNNASYTATVRGIGDTTGIAVVEVYALAQFSFNPPGSAAQ